MTSTNERVIQQKIAVGMKFKIAILASLVAIHSGMVMLSGFLPLKIIIEHVLHLSLEYILAQIFYCVLNEALFLLDQLISQ